MSNEITAHKAELYKLKLELDSLMNNHKKLMDDMNVMLSCMARLHSLIQEHHTREGRR